MFIMCLLQADYGWPMLFCIQSENNCLFNGRVSSTYIYCKFLYYWIYIYHFIICFLCMLYVSFLLATLKIFFYFFFFFSTFTIMCIDVIFLLFILRVCSLELRSLIFSQIRKHLVIFFPSNMFSITFFLSSLQST